MQRLTIPIAEAWPAKTATCGTNNCHLFVASGSIATATCSGVVDGEYKWQARADDGTSTSAWAGY